MRLELISPYPLHNLHKQKIGHLKTHTYLVNFPRNGIIYIVWRLTKLDQIYEPQLHEILQMIEFCDLLTK